jgi:hypothetical protein
MHLARAVQPLFHSLSQGCLEACRHPRSKHQLWISISQTRLHGHPRQWPSVLRWQAA